MSFELQSLEIENEQTVLFWDNLWHKIFLCMNWEHYIDLEYAQEPPWPNGFEKIYKPNPENLHVKRVRIEAFLLDF